MKCAICGITVESMDEAVEGGWKSYFYDGEKEPEAACPKCSDALFQMGEDGEMEVMEEYRGKP
jgi:DNA-directed RNA polymerase subunit RPC12/RpoP